LDELRRQGLVRREPGRGTFLASLRLRSNLAYPHRFSEEIERWGYTPGARHISQEERITEEEVTAQLEFEVGEKVLFVRRLRLADERPIFVCDSHLPMGRFPVLKDADYGTISLSRLFEERTGRDFEYSRQWIGAATATPDVAALLKIPAGVPVLKVRRITLVTGDAPIESSRRTSTPSDTSTTTDSPPGP
jgi:GntR family transcriptional regulator